jgi:hypothetical protein
MSITRKQIANEFRKALDVLWDGGKHSRGDVKEGFKEEFICLCLQHANGKWIMGHLMSRPAQAARKVIQDRIKPFTTVEVWLYENHHEARPKRSVTIAQQKKLQAYRKAWLQSLIVEFSK